MPRGTAHAAIAETKRGVWPVLCSGGRAILERIQENTRRLSPAKQPGEKGFLDKRGGSK